MPSKQMPTLGPNNYSGDFYSNRGNAVYPGVRSGTKVYGWRKKIKEGSSAGSPFTSDRYFVDKIQPLSGFQTVVYTNGSNTYTYATYPLSFNGFASDLQYGDFAHVGGVSSDAEAQALSRAYDKIRSESYGANGLLFLGELRETIKLIKRPFAAIQDNTIKYLSALKAARRDVQRRVIRRKSESDRFFVKRRLDAVKNAVAGSWLEYQFGIVPAISDIKEIANEAIGQIYGRDDKTRLRAKSTDTVTVTNAYAYLVPWTYGHKCEQFKTVYTRGGVQYVIGLKRSLSAPTAGLQKAASGFGFQIQNFVPTIYELIPYSFLLDYITNTGDIIEAACTDTTAVSWIVRTQRLSTTTDFREEVGGFRFAPSGDPDFWTKDQGGELSSLRTIRHVTTTRTIPDTLGIPPFTVSLPGSDSGKWLNVLALLGQSSGYKFR